MPAYTVFNNFGHYLYNVKARNKWLGWVYDLIATLSVLLFKKRVPSTVEQLLDL